MTFNTPEYNLYPGMFLRRKIILVSLFVVLMSLLGCSEEKTYKIGVSQCSQDDWRMKMNDEINREIMFHEDAVVEIRSADDNNERQISDIRYFADNDFDIIIVSPNEAAALTPIIKEVYERGIPVVVFDRNINGDTYTARIGVDDEGLGRSAAHYALHMLGSEAKAIEIYGLSGSTLPWAGTKALLENSRPEEARCLPVCRATGTRKMPFW